MKFELHITIPDGIEVDELVPTALADVADVIRQPPASISGGMGGIYHPDAPMRLGYWKLS